MEYKKISGYHGISNELLKCCFPVVEQNPSEAFNEWNKKHRTFLKYLEKAKFIALHEKSDFGDPENDRPIRLLNLQSKVFEKLLCNRMCFENKNSLFTPCQFGFCSKLCGVHAISEATAFKKGTIDKI